MPRAKRSRAAYMISAVAQQFDIHPQTLRLYEREGLLKPSRTEGNTRLYTDDDLERLEIILALTRDMGVNLAGVDIVLNMREKMLEMQRQTQEFVEFVRREWLQRSAVNEERIKNALVKVGAPRITPAKKA
ncbi:MAG: helix-turn-helix transcriptional regulator [Acidobacteria bacterium]|jgi:MerR family transcriptional regulator/heat shock protein HspR|nr:helix-turn-helix transcriptional regulator [Acidobacteriota bacterium]